MNLSNPQVSQRTLLAYNGNGQEGRATGALVVAVSPATAMFWRGYYDSLPNSPGWIPRRENNAAAVDRIHPPTMLVAAAA